MLNERLIEEMKQSGMKPEDVAKAFGTADDNKEQREKLNEPTTFWTLWFDGSCQPINPDGHACGGWVIRDKQLRPIHKDYVHFGSGQGMTNNFAEYMALLGGLVFLHDGRKRDNLNLTILGDSQLVVNQLSEVWGGKDQRLLDLRDQCWTMLKEMNCRWTIKWIPREKNVEADELSTMLQNSLPSLKLTPAQKRQVWAINNSKRRKRS